MSDKIIHRFWAGGEMPEDYHNYFEQWGRLNPDYLVVDWNEKDLDQFSYLKPVFDDLYARDAGRRGIELFVQLADVMGYALVFKFGGVYVNCDIQPVRPLPEMPDKAWASYENHEDGRIVNAAIGAPAPGDPFWRGLCENLPDRYFSRPGEEMIMQTGPGYLTDFAHEHPDLLHVLPVESFNPVHWGNVPSGGTASEWVSRGEFPAETIGVHHWGHRRDGRSNHVETATQ